jgi:ubiquinone/menaquinone biosynthesis C-methylase UbiE
MNSNNAQSFNRIATTILAPVNPVIARQIVECTGITTGQAIDIGSGPAHLSIELAKITDLTIHAVDISDAMLSIAAKNVQAAGLEERVLPVLGNVEDLPFPDNAAHLIMSKGSVFLWDDLPRAFSEIHRVLGKGGTAWIGGGFGSPDLFDEVQVRMHEYDPEWIDNVRDRLSDATVCRFEKALKAADIHHYRFIHDPWQLWIVVEKEEN